MEATLVGVPQLTVSLTDEENGQLNPLGVNCLRAMPAADRVVWGSRTLQGDAYFVKCDKGTTTQNDINLSIVNIIVGFVPLKPAEFVIIKIQQMAGQIAT